MDKRNLSQTTNHKIQHELEMWSVPNICLTIFGLVLMVTPLALWVAWTRAIFIGVLVAAFISLIGAVIVTRTKRYNR